MIKQKLLIYFPTNTYSKCILRSHGSCPPYIIHYDTKYENNMQHPRWRLYIRHAIMSDALFSMRFLWTILAHKCKNIFQDISILKRLKQIDTIVRITGSANAQKDTSNFCFICLFLYVCFFDKSTLSRLKFLIVCTLSLIYLNNVGIRKV